MKRVVYLILAGWLFLSGIAGCGRRRMPEKLRFPEEMVLNFPDSTKRLFSDYIRESEETFIVYIDAGCSPCLLSLTWWVDFLKQHARLHPAVLFDTDNFLLVDLYFPEGFFPIAWPVWSGEPVTLWTENGLDRFSANFVWIDREGTVLLSGNMADDRIRMRFESAYEKLTDTL